MSNEGYGNNGEINKPFRVEMSGKVPEDYWE
jgi:hypothetical protein